MSIFSESKQEVIIKFKGVNYICSWALYSKSRDFWFIVREETQFSSLYRYTPRLHESAEICQLLNKWHGGYAGLSFQEFLDKMGNG